MKRKAHIIKKVSEFLRGYVKNLDEILLKIDSQNLSDIAEIETGYDLDQAQLKKAIKDQVKNLLVKYDLKSGQCVLLKNSNNIKFFIDFLALYFLEVTAVPVDPKISTYEYQTMLRSVEPRLVITDQEELLFSGKIRDEFLDVALILFTSGTTSNPKGVLITKKSLDLKMKLFEKVIGAESISRTLCFIPTFFGHGLICNSLFPIFYGKKFFIAQAMTIDFSEKFAHLLEEKKITFFSTVPSHWEFILNFSTHLKEHSLKRVHSASAPLRHHKLEKIIEWLGPKVSFYDVYGATEMLGWFSARKIDKNSNESIFEDFWDAEGKLNEKGELVLKSEYMFKGYWTENGIERLGEFNTGDIFLGSVLKGRTKNIINKNGIKIQTEDVIVDVLRSGLVIEAAAFPIPDDYSGERIGLFVVFKDHSSLDDLWSYCQNNFTSSRLPSEIIAVAKIPVNRRGKYSLNELQKIFFDLNHLNDDALKIFNSIFKSKYEEIDIARESVPNWDSMRHAELIVTLQKKYSIKFSVNDLIKVKNYKDLIQLIKNEKLNQGL